ncbi:site-specific DNA-methyltransferase [Brevibacterium sp. 50QC2O2]|uniref:site-specific DNA-methyltransferase n=1 Tax=unclassified Brevibacterium TaxID=2614124 RepID=UPI00211C4625|nr:MULTISPECIES: site-specific DNA-methyltransferase [unclassified Brevibacterium]MCQ9367616.1 site-specific DNA-methyltransferase [Brevibacterium sp. 91QC2O2]MCQ9389024.1 site-specific DNA-methyltransferase [Brevibacterium sp. 50QC2O2]
MEKLRMTSPDLTEANIDKLAELFPTVVTETLDDEGNPQRAIDFDLLHQELSDHIVEGPQERYRLDWPGKRAAAFAANAPIAKTLRPVREESVDFDTTKNLFIEGDNLDALKLLQESYLGKVKLIYIDPPYNTGSDSLVYEDDRTTTVAEHLLRSGQVSDAGERFVTNTESNGRFHSDWLTMMYPRLKLARNLLTSDGLIVISIDENEVANLVRLCEEIFGHDNVLGALPVVMNLKGNQDAFGFAETHEFIVVCLRDKASATLGEFPVDEEALIAEWAEDEYGLYKEADNLRATGVNAPRSKRPNLWYPIFINTNTLQPYVTEDDLPLDSQDVVVWPVNPAGEELSWYWKKSKFAAETHNLVLKHTKNGYQFYKKQRPELGALPSKKPKSFWFKPSYSTSTATKQLKELMGGRYFSAPKPVPFLEDILRIGSERDSIVLDFFAGSGSFGHAIMKLNAEDGGNRRYILVQVEEPLPDGSDAVRAGFPTIPALARERLRRAADQTRTLAGLSGTAVDGGFRTLKIDTTNMIDVIREPDATDQLALTELEPSIKSDRTAEDLLFQVLIDWGLELTMPVEKETIAEHRVFDVEEGALIACFDNSIGLDVIREIASRKPVRAVFRDDGFESDAQRINVEQIFREVSPSTEVKAI